MPISGGNYVAPTWANGANPAINAAELQAMSNTLAACQAPTNHAAASTKYGIAKNTQYGHVALSDTPSDTYDQTSGVAATPKAVAAVQTAASNAQSTANSAQSTANAALSAANGKAKATGGSSYQGTGTSGSGNKTSLDFNTATNVPTLILISNRPTQSNSVLLAIIVPALQLGYTLTNSADRGYNQLLHVSTSGGVVSWYHNTSKEYQMNDNGQTYTWKAMY